MRFISPSASRVVRLGEGNQHADFFNRHLWILLPCGKKLHYCGLYFRTSLFFMGTDLFLKNEYHKQLRTSPAAVPCKPDRNGGTSGGLRLSAVYTWQRKNMWWRVRKEKYENEDYKATIREKMGIFSMIAPSFCPKEHRFYFSFPPSLQDMFTLACTDMG